MRIVSCQSCLSAVLNTCTYFFPVASTMEIRLTGTNSFLLIGRVEVNVDGRGWGTVCDDSWSLQDAFVACRMLGFGSAIETTIQGWPFGEGNGTIWLDDVVCFGNESTLLECSHSSVGEHNCHHYEDAGVMCSRE